MLRRIRGSLVRFVANRDGLETVEYAITTGLILAATITVIAAISAWLFLTFTSLHTSVGA